MDAETVAAVLSGVASIITAYAGLKLATRKSEDEIEKAVHDALEHEHEREAHA